MYVCMYIFISSTLVIAEYKYEYIYTSTNTYCRGGSRILKKGGSKVMHEAPGERNEARSASGVGGCLRGNPPSHPFDFILDKTLEIV